MRNKNTPFVKFVLFVVKFKKPRTGLEDLSTNYMNGTNSFLELFKNFKTLRDLRVLRGELKPAGQELKGFTTKGFKILVK